jgi:hypothetical protein
MLEKVKLAFIADPEHHARAVAADAHSTEQKIPNPKHQIPRNFQ